jgi:hypothetical protein
MDVDLKGFEGRWGCCSVVQQAERNVGGMACTPWGPPSPPAMRWLA